MDLFDVIIVGSGPAGAMAALALEGKNVLVLDVGYRPPPAPDLDGTLHEARQRDADLFEFLIGRNFDSLHNMHQRAISLKLKAPLMTYILRESQSLSPVRSTNFDAAMSFAAGGLANAWGAGVYRFDSRDLAGCPVTPAELEPYYNQLTRHIGISGSNDDLVPWFGEDDDLEPPVELSRFASDLLLNYTRKRPWFAARGIAIGRQRLAILTRPHGNRRPYRYGNFEFFRPCDPAVYNPAYTLDDLVDANKVHYEPNRLVLRYAERPECAEVTARNLATGSHETFRGRALMLAAGALNSAKLVLASNDDCETRLPVLDNPITALPLFRLRRIGEALDWRDSSIGQLILICEHQGRQLQGSIYGAAGPLRSDVLFQLPLSISANLSWLRRLAAATGLLMIFYPDDPRPENYLRLTPDGALEINHEGPVISGAEPSLVKAMRKIGFQTAMALCQRPGMGAAIHYAGTLPMQSSPGRYQLYPDGRLFGTRSVYVADGACFPRLPAKNLTFTIMANAMRIASAIPL